MKKEDRLQKTISESGKALVVQQHNIFQSEQRVTEVQRDLKQLNNLQQQQSDVLDQLLTQAEDLLHDNPLEETEVVEFDRIAETNYDQLSTVGVEGADSWDKYMLNIESYAELHQIHIQKDPFSQLLTERERAEIVQQVQKDYHMKKANCDKYDYAIAASCGVLTGFIDVFFVGAAKKSKLGSWTEEKVDRTIIKFSKTIWRSDKNNGAKLKKEPDSIASAIGFLERRFKVNYDARYTEDLKLNGQNLTMRPSNHHLKSLGHSPDIVGLFFSILDQFTGKASFISGGKILRLVPVENKQKFELRGNNLLAKIFAGFANWFGHLMSDIAGSSGTRGHMDGRKGSGIPMPLFSLFQMVDIGAIKSGDEHLTIAEFSTQVFEAGYDARHGLTMAIPVALNELMIRLLWSLKSLFYHKNTLLESFPVGNKPELRRMLLVGHGALCAIDGTDAYLRSPHNILGIAERLNLVAWSRFGMSALLEVRSLYKAQSLDINAMDQDLYREWERLFDD